MEELAKSMGVTESDLMCLARSVVGSIVDDCAAKQFLDANEKIRMEMVEAYVAHAIEKFNAFHTAFLTNPEAKDKFVRTLLSIC